MVYLSDEERLKRKRASHKRWLANLSDEKRKQKYLYDKTYNKNYYQDNKEKCLSDVSTYQKANKAKMAAKQAKRQSSKKNRTPSWLTIDDFKLIESFYIKAKNLEITTGIKHRVDHIIPLQGKNVSGLHMPNNLQIIPAIDNIKKSNKY